MIMSRRLLTALLGGSAFCLSATPICADESDPALQDVIIVTGSRIDTATALGVTPETAPLQGGDITYLIARTPGGARIANGQLSGQMQYRGLFGERLNLRVDGQRFSSGGPNLMDPVFHYAPAPLVSAIVIDRGVSPVSAGPGMAGGADAVFKRIDYSEGSELVFGYDLTLGGRTINESVSTGGVFGVSADDWRYNLLGSWEEGNDTEFGDGVVAGTALERGVYGVSVGTRTGLGEFSLDLRRQNTGPSGNPPFPMDIVYFDTDFARLGYSAQFGGAALNASLHYTDVAHLMDNFSQRPEPSLMSQRATFAYATTRGGALSASFEAAGGEIELGIDGERVDHDVTITNPNNSDFFVTPFPKIEQDRVGAFVEWRGRIGAIHSELGARLDRHTYETGNARVGPALPMGPRMLALGFNGEDGTGDDLTSDIVARFWTSPKEGLSWRGTLARKQNVPGYIQRYGWLPINASGGLADGNIYVGDLTLDPEAAWIAELGFDYTSAKAYVRPTVFVRRIDDYIQGVPFDATIGVADTTIEMIAAMSGDPTPLRWANVDAQLFGIDLDAGYDFDGPLRLDTVVNYVRGERSDVNDNLYRVASPNLSVALTWEATNWSATIETRAVADQENISWANSEQESEGYAVFSLYGDWLIDDGMTIAFGIENLFDEVYRDHLSGYNRNGFGDVSIGERLPGAGRGAFVRLNLSG